MSGGLRLLHNALSRNEMKLFYQPIFHIASGRLAGAEALLRWQSAELGMLLPAQFLATAEETGEIVPIGTWTIASVCAQISNWSHWLPEEFRVSINLSSLQFWQDSLSAGIARTLNEWAIPPNRIELDIAAETLMEDWTQGIAILKRLKAVGVALTLDRYGHGASPGEFLVRLPVDALKIDPLLITGDEW